MSSELYFLHHLQPVADRQLRAVSYEALEQASEALTRLAACHLAAAGIGVRAGGSNRPFSTSPETLACLPLVSALEVAGDIHRAEAVLRGHGFQVEDGEVRG